MNRVAVILLAALALAVAGCPTITGALNDALDNLNTNGNANSNTNGNSNSNENSSGQISDEFDGNWQLTLLGDRAGTACLIIDGGAISSWNDGCASAFQEIVTSQPVSIAGSAAVWSLQTTDATGGTMITLNTTVQADGNLLGTLTIDDPRGGRFQSNVIVVRR